MTQKKRLWITPIISYILLIGFSCFSYLYRASSFTYVTVGLSALGAILLIALIPIAHRRLTLAPIDGIPPLPYSPPHSQRWFSLILNQTLILLGSGVLLFAIVLQSQTNPRIPSLPFESLIPLVQDHACYAFLPWLIISALSVLSTQRAEKIKRMVWLPILTIGPAPHQPKKFFLSAYNDSLNMAITIAGILLVCLSMGLIFESFAQFGLIASAWQTPIRSAMFMFILFIFSYRARDRLLKKYVRRSFSLGALLFIQAFLIVIFLFIFEALLNFSEFPIQEQLLQHNAELPPANILASHYLGTILMIWTLCLIPYLLPLFARLSLGLRAWQAFLMPLLIPGLLFLWLLPHHLSEAAFLDFISEQQQPTPLFLLGLFGLVVLYFIFQHVRSFFDLHVGSMPLVNPPYKNLGLFLISRPLLKGVLNCMALIFISGWSVIHVMLYGIGLFFILCLSISAIWFLISNFKVQKKAEATLCGGV